MTYGAILGVLLVILSVVTYMMGVNPRESVVTMIVTYGAMIAIMIYGTNAYKNNEGEGFISFGHAFKVGFSIIFFSALIQAFYIYIFAGFIDPEFITVMLEQAEAGMLESQPNMSDEQIEVAMNMTAKMMTPGMIATWTILGQAVVGAIISLITGAFLKKDNPAAI